MGLRMGTSGLLTYYAPSFLACLPSLGCGSICLRPAALQWTALGCQVRQYCHNSYRKERDSSRLTGDLESYFRVPPELESATTRKGRILEGRFEIAVESVLNADGLLREQLVMKNGFTVHKIRLSRGQRKATILWDCYPGKVAECARIAVANAFRMKNMIARNLRGRHVPHLEFVHDHLPPAKEDLVRAFEHVERELAEQASRDDSETPGQQEEQVADKEATTINTAVKRLSWAIGRSRRL